MYNVILASTDLGVHVDGTNLGPNVIIKYIKNKKINEIIDIEKDKIIKDKDHLNLKKNLDYINKFNSELYLQAYNSLKNGCIPITIGGDHSLAIATALASSDFYKEDIGVLWIDAHTDFNTFETTETGNIHGLPLAAIAGLCKGLDDFANNNVKPQNIFVLGARSIDKKEKVVTNKANINVISTDYLLKHDTKEIIDNIFKAMPSKVHVSYDLDLIDPFDAPGVSVPEIDGIRKKQAYEIMDCLKKYQQRITSFDLVEYNPTFDKNDKTLKIAIDILNKFMND